MPKRNKITFVIEDSSDEPDGKVTITSKPNRAELIAITKNGNSTSAVGYAVSFWLMALGIDLENAKGVTGLSERLSKSGLILPGES